LFEGWAGGEAVFGGVVIDLVGELGNGSVAGVAVV